MSSGAQWDSPLIPVAIWVFAGVFLVVGLMRTVEFTGVGLSPVVRRALIAAHWIGCALFSAAMALLGADPAQRHHSWMTGLFFGGLALLFPAHIYIGIKRRIRIRDSEERK